MIEGRERDSSSGETDSIILDNGKKALSMEKDYGSRSQTKAIDLTLTMESGRTARYKATESIQLSLIKCMKGNSSVF